MPSAARRSATHPAGWRGISGPRSVEGRAPARRPARRRRPRRRGRRPRRRCRGGGPFRGGCLDAEAGTEGLLGAVAGRTMVLHQGLLLVPWAGPLARRPPDLLVGGVLKPRTGSKSRAVAVCWAVARRLFGFAALLAGNSVPFRSSEAVSARSTVAASKRSRGRRPSPSRTTPRRLRLRRTHSAETP